MSVLAAIFGIRAAKSSFVDPVSGSTWVSLGSGSSFETRAGQTASDESAKTLPVYWACLNVVASDCGKIPRKAYRSRADRGKDVVTDHPVYRLVHNAPNPESIPLTFYEALVLNAASDGNGYAEIERDGATRPIALWIIHPSRVMPKRRASGELYYEIRNEAGTYVEIEAVNMLHVPGLGWNGLAGFSVLQYQSESLGLGLAAQAFGSDFFANGANPSGVLKHPGTMSKQAQDRLRETWGERYGGANRHKPGILEEGMEWLQISVPPNEAQFLQTRKFQVEEICRWFRVAPEKVMDRGEAKGWSSREIAETDHVESCLMPWLERLEQELTRKLFSAAELAQGFYVRHVVQGLARGDMKTRVTYYRMRQMMGSMSPNDIRELEDENPLPPGKGGDEYFMMSNMVRLEDIASGKSAPSPSATEGSDGGEDNEKRSDKEGDDKGKDGGDAGDRAAVARAMLPILEDAARRMLRKEAKAAIRLASKHAADAKAFASALREFWSRHSAHVVEAIEPAALSALGKASGEDRADARHHLCTAARMWAEDAAAEYADAFADSAVASCAQARERSLPGRWARLAGWIVGMTVCEETTNAHDAA